MPYQQVHDLMFPHGAISRIEPLDPKVQSSKGLPPAWVVYFQMYDAGRDIMRVSLLLPPDLHWLATYTDHRQRL